MAWAAVGAVVSAGISYEGTQSAASAAQGANQQNIQAQQIANMQRDPFSTSGARAQYVPQLNQLMQGGYAGIAQDPMFQARQNQAMEAVQRRMSAMGQGMGTNDLLALQNQSYLQQGDFFNEQFNRLSSLSGASQGGTGVGAATGMSPVTAGQIAAAPGQALAEGIGGVYGAWKMNQQPTSATPATPDYTMYNATMAGANTGMENPVGV